ncbi:hypothetical protein BD560DRAFT_206813 [Blakeslea trispora]|nr:hypothetical protein BD560DRAFT_206813 [Blakeslea trispora]
MFLALADKKAILFTMREMKFDLQCEVSAGLNSPWTGGSFFDHDQFLVWNREGHVYHYRLEVKEDVCQPVLMCTYKLNNQGLNEHCSTVTSIIQRPGSQNQPLLINIVNCSEESGYSVVPIQTQHSEIIYNIDDTFGSIWPLVHKVDPSFGQITATAPVNTNHLAIGIRNDLCCTFIISFALLFRYSKSSGRT